MAAVRGNHGCFHHIRRRICDFVAGRQPYQMFLFRGHVPDFRLRNVSKPTEVAGINAGTNPRLPEAALSFHFGTNGTLPLNQGYLTADARRFHNASETEPHSEESRRAS